jgi:uncharacterized lipoprotein YmbA
VRIQILKWLLPLMLVVTGCAGSPPTQIYVLGYPEDPARGMIAQADRPILRLFPVSIPDYLDTRDILIRSGQNQVTASPTGRWAERLSLGMTRALAAALTTRLPDAEIIYNQSVVPPARQILVDVEALEIRPDRECLLTASWTLAGSDGDQVLHRERDNFIQQATDTSDAAIAAAISRTIDQLADKIASRAQSSPGTGQ